MTDLDQLLAQAAQAHRQPSAPDGVVDADLARARRALTHQRMRRSGARSVVAASLAVGAFAALQGQGHHGSSTTAGKPSTAPATVTVGGATTAGTAPVRTTTKPADLAVKLVSYTGAQPEGYTVDSVPAGWEIQGVNNLDLAIAPVGFADQSLNDFEGKLVVMLLSADATPPTTGVPVDVGVAGTGRISHENPEPILTFKDTSGHWLDIQVPTALHWSDAQVAAFGSAVHANATAVAGVG
jgi:hypothetical protein